MKSYSEGRTELRNLRFLKKMLEKACQFLSSDQPCELKSLDVASNIAGVEKYARKTCDCGQCGGHSIRVLNEKERWWRWKFVFFVVGILKSIWNCVGNTFWLRCSWPWAVVSCSLLAALPWTGLEYSHRKGRLCVYLTLRRDVCSWFFAFLNINQCVKNFLPLRKVEFIKWINLIHVLLLGLLSNGSQLTKTNFVFGLSRSTAESLRILSEQFSKKVTALSFFFLLDYASRTCWMPRQYFFVLIFCPIM